MKMKTAFRSDELAWIEQAKAKAIANGKANLLLLARQLLKEGTTYMAGKGRPKKVDENAVALLEALTFVQVAGSKKQAAYNEHVQFLNGWAIMSDGQISAGHPIKEELNASPHFAKLKFALNKVGKSLAITQLETNRLSIKGELSRFVVPCMLDYPDVDWDDQVYPADDSLKTAFAKCGLLTDENATDYISASLYVQPYICSATDRKALIQVKHTVNFPPVALPKIFTQAVAKSKMSIVGFGYTENHSITIFFENGAWIKTLVYVDPWPIENFSQVLDTPSNYVEDMPKELEPAIEIVAKFKEDEENNNIVLLGNNTVQSHISDEVGAQSLVIFNGQGKQVNADHFKSIGMLITQLDVQSYPAKIMFFGDNMRGAMVCYINALQG